VNILQGEVLLVNGSKYSDLNLTVSPDHIPFVDWAEAGSFNTFNFSGGQASDDFDAFLELEVDAQLKMFVPAQTVSPLFVYISVTALTAADFGTGAAVSGFAAINFFD